MRRSALRAAVATLSGATVVVLGSCGSDRTVTPVERPPAPRIGEPGEGPDPLDEAPRRTPRNNVPAPPVAVAIEATAASGLPSPAGSDATLYVIGERALTAADLGDFILRYFPDRAREPLGQLVDAALVDHEATREQVNVSDAQVRERAEVYIAERRREVRIQYGEETTLEQLLERSFGRTLDEFRRDAERLARVGLVRDRLVRLEQRRLDRVDVRALTFAEESEARNAVDRLRAGADLTLLAQRLGMRPPSAPPPLGRDDIRPVERAEELFGKTAGEVLDARAFTAPDGSTWWEVVKVVEIWSGDDRPWAALRDAIETSIAVRAVGVPEYLAWRRRVLRRAGVEVRREGRGLVPWIEQE